MRYFDGGMVTGIQREKCNGQVTMARCYIPVTLSFSNSPYYAAMESCFWRVGMKSVLLRILCLSALLLTGITGSLKAADNEDVIWTVGTDTNGVMIQQVEWIYKDKALTQTNCPIPTRTVLKILKEHGESVQIQCDGAMLARTRWHASVKKGNIVIGWLAKERLAKVKASVWQKQREKENVVIRTGFLPEFVMQHPSGVVFDPVKLKPMKEFYFDVGDDPRSMRQIIVAYPDGMKTPSEHGRKIVLRGTVSTIKLGGEPRTKGAYSNEVLTLKSWEYSKDDSLRKLLWPDDKEPEGFMQGLQLVVLPVERCRKIIKSAKGGEIPHKRVMIKTPLEAAAYFGSHLNMGEPPKYMAVHEEDGRKYYLFSGGLHWKKMPPFTQAAVLVQTGQIRSYEQ